jgi:mRNA-degrading endonuclease RelE of RelBE toxin-antitoxin system
MSFAVIVRETALRAPARIRAEDKEVFAAIRRAPAALAEPPHPDEAAAWGGSEIYRLHLPGIRIVYEADEDIATVHVINVAATA